MAKLKKVTALGKEVNLSPINDQDYFSLNDMIKGDDGERLIRNWLRNKKTIEFLGEWEILNNPNFNCTEFDTIKNESGNQDFSLSIKLWIDKTNAIGIKSRSGRYGGTWAHIDIAFHFAMWYSPKFHLAIIKDYQRLKREEVEKGPWNAKRLLAKVNYRLHTDAIKDFIIPYSEKPDFVEYATEADLINMAVFGMTAAEWEKKNPELAKQGNQRDFADVCQLSVLANMEAYNSMLISSDLTPEVRQMMIFKESKRQLQSLYKAEIEKRSYLGN
jgi:hypothetical protein